MARIAINGFGRIGRATFKAGWDKKGFNVVAINDLTDAKTLAHLLKYDTNYGKWKVPVRATKSHLIIGKTKIPVFAEKDPAQLPWAEQRVDVVIESTGIFRTKELAGQHLKAGAKRVIISAPAKSEGVPTVVLGTNKPNTKAKILNNASCTTNATSPVVAIMDAAFGVKKAMLTTIHGYTSTQNIVDGPHEDLRRARAAAENMIPTSTGAAIATTKTLPKLKNKFEGIAVRVPVPTVSLADITLLLKSKVTKDKIDAVVKRAVKSTRWKGIVDYTNEPLVSSDFIGNPHSAVVDLEMTRVVDGDLVKIVAWYDNEWGYAQRLAELTVLVAKSI